MTINFTLDPGAYMPTKAHEADAGFDLYCKEAVTFAKNVFDSCNKRFDRELLIDTGVHIAIPKGYVGLVMGRSGLNRNKSIICPTGVIDSGFTGSILVKLYNLSNLPGDPVDASFDKGDRIAQLLIVPIADVTLRQVDKLDITERGDNGFGSSGK